MAVPNPVTRLPLLRPVPIFRGLTKVALLQVARRAVEVSYPPDSVIVQEGDPGDSLCIICRGTVAVMKGERVIAHLESGDFFGEISLIDGEPRSATVIATDDVELLTLSADAFDTLLNDPYFSRAALRSLALRFRSALHSHEAQRL